MSDLNGAAVGGPPSTVTSPLAAALHSQYPELHLDPWPGYFLVSCKSGLWADNPLPPVVAVLRLLGDGGPPGSPACRVDLRAVCTGRVLRSETLADTSDASALLASLAKDRVRLCADRKHLLEEGQDCRECGEEEEGERDLVQVKLEEQSDGGGHTEWGGNGSKRSRIGQLLHAEEARSFNIGSLSVTKSKGGGGARARDAGSDFEDVDFSLSEEEEEEEEFSMEGGEEGEEEEEDALWDPPPRKKAGQRRFAMKEEEEEEGEEVFEEDGDEGFRRRGRGRASSDAALKCAKCSRDYKSSASYAKHVKICSIGEPGNLVKDTSLRCKICLVQLSSDATFKSHMALHLEKLNGGKDLGRTNRGDNFQIENKRALKQCLGRVRKKSLRARKNLRSQKGQRLVFGKKYEK